VVSHHHLGSCNHCGVHATVSAPSYENADEHANDESTNDRTNYNGGYFT
jgi:hypothetical protein